MRRKDACAHVLFLQKVYLCSSIFQDARKQVQPKDGKFFLYLSSLDVLEVDVEIKQACI